MQEPHAPKTPSDLGLGRVLADESTTRFLNQDGSFNVERRHLGRWQALSLYDELLSMSWWQFLSYLLLFYLLLNLLFALLYWAIGPTSFYDFPGRDDAAHFLGAFFFSVQTFGTIGYGHVAPRSLPANLLVTLEAFVGLTGQALATGIIFARFSRPSQRVLFSDVAVVAPYYDGAGLMIRLINGRRTQLIELEMDITLSQYELMDGKRSRNFRSLKLERNRVNFLPLALTVVHPIDHESPLWNLSEAQFKAGNPELLITLRGQSEASYQTIHVRRSYVQSEVRWGQRFVSMYLPPRQGRVAVDARKLSLTESAPLENAAQQQESA